MRLLTLLCTLLALPAHACELALLLAVDISGSVDEREYRTQMNGLAAGLRDGLVSEALVQADARVSLVQWTGASRQEFSIPWTRVDSFDALETLAQRIETTPRAWRNFSTAIGEALRFSLPLFDQAGDCGRRVIDVSGDGTSNEGTPPQMLHPNLALAQITVNALVIEGAENELTAYFWENVITGPGAFVVVANSFAEYPDRMRQKLQREVAKPVSAAPAPPGATRFAAGGRFGPCCDHAAYACDHSLGTIRPDRPSPARY